MMYPNYIKHRDCKLMHDNINKMKDFIYKYKSNIFTHMIDTDPDSQSGLSVFSTYIELGTHKKYIVKTELTYEEIKKCDIENILHRNEYVLFNKLN